MQGRVSTIPSTSYPSKRLSDVETGISFWKKQGARRHLSPLAVHEKARQSELSGRHEAKQDDDDESACQQIQDEHQVLPPICIQPQGRPHVLQRLRMG